jgi:hypothetical protein
MVSETSADWLLADQTECARVFRAEKEMQVGVLAGIPFRPAVLPVWPPVIAGILAKDVYRSCYARRVSSVENKLRAALRRDRCVVHDNFLLLFGGAHLVAGFDLHGYQSICIRQSLTLEIAVSTGLQPLRRHYESRNRNCISMEKGAVRGDEQVGFAKRQLRAENAPSPGALAVARINRYSGENARVAHSSELYPEPIDDCTSHRNGRQRCIVTYVSCYFCRGLNRLADPRR